MKLLFVIPSLGSGGAERVASTLINEWAVKKNITIDIIVLNEGDDFYLLNPNVNVHKLNYKGGQRAIRKLISLFILLFKLHFVINKINPSVILSFIREANIFTLLATLLTKNKVVISERDSPSAHVSWGYNILRKITYPWAKSLIAQTTDYKNYISTIVDKSNIVVIPNPIREIIFNEIPREKIILNVGRLIHEKGQLLLLQAFSKIKDNNDWKLVILGGGVLKDVLLQEAEKLNIRDRVHLMGVSDNVDDWLNRASIFAFSSISEGFPNALLEAMVAGVPCVSFNCISGPKDIIVNGKNGYLVEVGNIDEFAKKINFLINNEQTRNSFSSESMLIAKKYTVDSIAEQYFSTLEAVVNKK